MADRNKALKEIKSSIELLNESAEKVRNHKYLTSEDKEKRLHDIEEAIDENYKMAKINFSASKEEVDSILYDSVKPEYVEKYKRRLEVRGMTDEDMQRKTIIENLVDGDDSGSESVKRRRRRKEAKDEIKRLSNEKELMEKYLIKSDEELEEIVNEAKKTNKKQEKASLDDHLIKVVEKDKVVPEEAHSVVVDESEVNKKSGSKRVLSGAKKTTKSKYDFDLSSIPPHVQYDVLPLPSNGECYSHKKNRIPVAYLTASDENLIASPNLYRDGKIIDLILERKILDKSINVRELCQGDRDAIVLWLRATGYGVDFPILARNPETGKQYPVNVRLDTFKYFPFNLVGDEDGYFEYKTDNGDVIKFKYLNVSEEESLTEDIVSKATDINKMDAVREIGKLVESSKGIISDEKARSEFDECIEDISDILDIKDVTFDDDALYTDGITNQMIKYTVSINGNNDRDFITSYIENMRAKDAFAYRTYVNDNTPGVNMRVNVPIPSSDGGGTFSTFLVLDNYVFTNI